MHEKQDKIGRSRRYNLKPISGFANTELAQGAALLQELAERVYDQIIDLPGEALDHTVQDTTLSISMLVLHMAWAEANWVRRITGADIPDPLYKEIEKGSLSPVSYTHLTLPTTPYV